MIEDESWNPQIDPDVCTGCGECIAVCPTDALELMEDIAVVSEPEACSYCGECEKVCPEGAVSLPYQIILMVDDDSFGAT